MRSLFTAFLLGLAAPAVAQPVQFGVVTKFDNGSMGLNAIDRIREAGVTMNRDGVGWRTVEASKETLVWPERYTSLYAALENRDIRTTVVLGTRNPLYDRGLFPTSPAAVAAFARFAAFTARTLGSRAVAFEVGNEWRPSPGISGQTTYVDYVRLFVAAANAIHAVDPNAKVVADPAIFAYAPATSVPAVGTPLGDAARRALAVADGVVVHQYPHQLQGMTPAQALAYTVSAMTRRAAWLEAIAGRPVPLYVTEYGWPRIPARGLTAPVQAQMMAATTRAFAAMPFVRVAIAYELVDSCTNEANSECTFGLYARGPQGPVARPAMAAFRGALVR